jgi:uncharacterized SAM-binding protein YcdF (DUF218 family)/glycosyltransferase involved in cell wall biosynthesis
MIRGRDIICISSIDWDFIWQGHQEIMSSLAAAGNRVLFIENTGVRAPGLRDFARLRSRIRNWLRATKGFRQERRNLFVYSPLILPFPYSGLARWVNLQLLRAALKRWMRATGFHASIVWTFLPTPLALDLMRDLQPELTVYYCIDDLASSSAAARRINRSEEQMFREADLVFVTSARLKERALRFRQQAHWFPFGVDYETFAQVRDAADQVPAELRAFRRPVAGYIGGIHQWIDQQLVGAVARAMPEVSFVFIGPCQTDVTALSQLPNVRFLGARQHKDVPKYVKGFDVGLVPYRSTEYTEHVYPTKLNEYLAMGIPVVAADLPEIRRFNEEHGPIVRIGHGPQAWVSAIQELAQPSLAAVRAERVEVARQNSWSERIARMSGLMEEALARSRERGDPRWREALIRAYRAARHRLIRVSLVLGIAYLAIAQTPLVWWLAAPLQAAEVVRPADAITVFAGGVGESGTAGGGYQERVKRAVDLYQAGLAPEIIFSSGYTVVFHEPEVMKELAVALGVPASAIVLETAARNTAENVTRVSQILRDRGHRSTLLVSSPYHMRRATAAFKKLAPELAVYPAPVLHSRFYAHTRGATLEQIRGLLHEYIGLLYYRVKGWA